MENYSKARTEEQPSVCPFPSLPPDTPEVRVKDGSKIRNLLRYALSRMEAKPRAAANEEGRRAAEEKEVVEQEVVEQEAVKQEAVEQEAAARALCRHLIFTATGKGVSKAITCAEIVKRRLKGLHQLTKLLFSTVVEVWEPLEPAAGLDSLTVSRNVPAIWILLSRDLLDPKEPGYQPPGRYDLLWAESLKEEAGQGTGHKRKKGGGAGGAGRVRGSGRQSGRS